MTHPSHDPSLSPLHSSVKALHAELRASALQVHSFVLLRPSTMVPQNALIQNAFNSSTSQTTRTSAHSFAHSFLASASISVSQSISSLYAIKNPRSFSPATPRTPSGAAARARDHSSRISESFKAAFDREVGMAGFDELRKGLVSVLGPKSGGGLTRKSRFWSCRISPRIMTVLVVKSDTPSPSPPSTRTG